MNILGRDVFIVKRRAFVAKPAMGRHVIPGLMLARDFAGASRNYHLPVWHLRWAWFDLRCIGPRRYHA